MDRIQFGFGLMTVSGEGTFGIAAAFTIVVLFLLSLWLRR
ncbi:hypothetical protein ACVINW_003854 [Bradyrhizobium sp. USDA 4461]